MYPACTALEMLLAPHVDQAGGGVSVGMGVTPGVTGRVTVLVGVSVGVAVGVLSVTMTASRSLISIYSPSFLF